MPWFCDRGGSFNLWMWLLFTGNMALSGCDVAALEKLRDENIRCSNIWDDPKHDAKWCVWVFPLWGSFVKGTKITVNVVKRRLSVSLSHFNLIFLYLLYHYVDIDPTSFFCMLSIDMQLCTSLWVLQGSSEISLQGYNPIIIARWERSLTIP